jgi:2-oxoglutarate ferredoxin oxidoreductase subunit beta
METNLSKKDFESDQEVRWCPGCGDYAILAAVQRFLPDLGVAPEKHVFVSGIGCSSRFPYYMNTYGFHTIHGRAPSVATGVKCSNPELTVWVITGDGDALSIGGNHLLHILRRNVDVNLLLFNNRIYGLTKGQYSPTSEVGKVTKSTPHGSIDHPVNPILFALGAQASFVARTVDRDAKHLAEVLKQAAAHKGTSFVEIYQNCNIFNDGAFEAFVDRSVRDEQQIHLEHEKLMIFGEKRDKGLALDGLKLKIVQFTAGDESAAEAAGVLRYDSTNRGLAVLIAQLDFPQFPVPMGVFYTEQRETFDGAFEKTSSLTRAAVTDPAAGNALLEKLYKQADTWTVG